MIVEHAIVGIATYMLTVTIMEKTYKMLYISRHLYGYVECRGSFGLFLFFFFFYRGLSHLALSFYTVPVSFFF
jgi:hypothetical protein